MNELPLPDTAWLLLGAMLVATLPIGFCLLEAGLVRQKNAVNVVYKNLMSFAAAALLFWAIGYGFMYGASAAGVIGTDRFLKSHAEGDGAFFLYQLVLCGVVAVIAGGALAERTRLVGYLAIAALLAALFYPLAGHWAWGGRTGVGEPGWLARLGFIDFAGASVVHGVAGWFALAAALVVGPRLGRFGADGAPPRAGSLPMATVGVLVLWFGWFGLGAGGVRGPEDELSVILVNIALAAASGGATLLGFVWITTRKARIGASLNGSLAGLVGVTAGAHLFETVDAMLVGVSAAALCGLATWLLAKRGIDDAIGVWPAHALAGALGTVLVAVLGDSARFATGNSPLGQFAVQCLGAGVIAAWAFGGGYVALRLLDRLLPLRVDAEAEQLGLNVAEHDASTDLVDLLGGMRAQQENGDFERAVAVEPHSEVGQIAEEYNRVLERVRLEIETREEAYRQLEEAGEFRFIFENAHEGIVQFARDGRIMKANPAAAVLLGFVSETDLVEQAGRWLAKLEGMDRSLHMSMLRTLEAHGVARTVELSFTRALDGRKADVQIDLRRVPGRDGTPTTVLGSIIDIGERKANERLRVERDAATTASLAKSEFLANMSHEIRTPLNGVTGMLELLGRTELDERQRRFVDIAGTSASALLSVINDILDVSKIEAGKLELDRAAFTLPELLADVIDMFAPQAAAKGVELASVVPSTIPERVIGDPERLRQVLVNLVGNAIKFTDEGAVTLRCATTRLDEGEAAFRLDIADSGPGIAAGELERLFQPFTQADGSTTRRHGGTGLGLTISRQLVELMGGQITVDSEPGAGTVFHVELPLALAEAPAAGAAASLDGWPRRHARQGVRVLAVDDHAINLELLTELLEPEGFELVCLSGAEPALAELARAADEGRPYGLALLDYQMPGNDGEQLARAIRADSRHDGLRLVLLTSIDQAIPAAERSRLRIHASLTKPLRRSRLFDAIDEALVGETRAQPPAADEPDPTGSESDGGEPKSGARDVAAPDSDDPHRAGADRGGDDEKIGSDGDALVDQPPEPISATDDTEGADEERTSGDVPADPASFDDRSTSSPDDVAEPEATANEPRESDAQRSAAPASSSQSAEQRSLLILVVEDNPVNQMVTEELLLAAGHIVTVADNGAEALEQLGAGDVEMVLMDCQMPVMDGFEATRRIRETEAREGLPRLPIIAVTANAIKGDRERCLEAAWTTTSPSPSTCRRSRRRSSG